MYQYYKKYGGEILPTIVVVNNKFERNKCVFLSEKPSEDRIWKRFKSEIETKDGVDALWLAMAGENYMFMCVHD